AVYGRPLEQLARRGHRAEGRVVYEVVVLAIALVRTSGPRRRGDGEHHVFVPLDEALRQRSLARTAGCRDDDGERPAAVHHSTFSACSRSRSMSSLLAITPCSIAPPLAFAPLVFASRFISWIRKPRRFP